MRGRSSLRSGRINNHHLNDIRETSDANLITVMVKTWRWHPPSSWTSSCLYYAFDGLTSGRTVCGETTSRNQQKVSMSTLSTCREPVCFGGNSGNKTTDTWWHLKSQGNIEGKSSGKQQKKKGSICRMKECL